MADNLQLISVIEAINFVLLWKGKPLKHSMQARTHTNTHDTNRSKHTHSFLLSRSLACEDEEGPITFNIPTNTKILNNRRHELMQDHRQGLRLIMDKLCCLFSFHGGPDGGPLAPFLPNLLCCSRVCYTSVYQQTDEALDNKAEKRKASAPFKCPTMAAQITKLAVFSQ